MKRTTGETTPLAQYASHRRARERLCYKCSQLTILSQIDFFFKFLKLLLNIWLNHYHLINLWKCVPNLVLCCLNLRFNKLVANKVILGNWGFICNGHVTSFDLITYRFIQICCEWTYKFLYKKAMHKSMIFDH